METDIMKSHAFFFYENKERILSDSRMAYARVPIHNGAGMIPLSCFEHPTLGAYLEWWDSCPQAHVMTKEGIRMIWHFQGSAMSGRNECEAVDKEGNSTVVHVRPFAPLWKTFADINTRYNRLTPQPEPYSLEQVLQLLTQEKM